MDPDSNCLPQGVPRVAFVPGPWKIVETRGFNGRIWLDTEGRPSTTELHVTERFTRTAFGRMTIDVTIDDPGAYTDLWHASVPFALQVGWEPLEYICGENNKIDAY